MSIKKIPFISIYLIYSTYETYNDGAREMIQQLRAYTVLTEDHNSVTLAPGELTPFCGLCRHLHKSCRDTQKCIHTHK